MSAMSDNISHHVLFLSEFQCGSQLTRACQGDVYKHDCL